MISNHEIAYRAERKRVVRHFHRYDHNQRADMMASHRLGYRQRESTGHFIYTHPDVPGVCFRTVKDAALAAMDRSA